MARSDWRIYGDRPRPQHTYSGSRAQDKRRGAATYLKAARIHRGVTRRELDREREAVRRYIIDGHVARGFTPGQLYGLVVGSVA